MGPWSKCVPGGTSALMLVPSKGLTNRDGDCQDTSPSTPPHCAQDGGS